MLRACLQTLLAVVVCVPFVGSSLASNDTLTQYSTLGALFQGMYDGRMTLAQLRAHGDFGLGTVNGLDGELLVVGGTFFQVKADGSVHVLPPHTQTPFAAVTMFEADQRRRAKGPLDYAGFREEVEGWLPTNNLFYAIKVEGKFVKLRARSVRKQMQPYKPLTEIVENQAVFEFENTRGTLVGFRVPEYASNLNVPGFHLHFLTADRNAGGHVLDFVLEDGKIEIDQLSQLLLILPQTEDFEKLDLRPTQPASIDKVEGPR